MNCFFTSLLLLCSLSGTAQDSILFTSHPLINREQAICITSDNQLACFDSLIIQYKNGLAYPEADQLRCYKKLTIYSINAAGIALMRGNENQCLAYLHHAGPYADSLSTHYKDDTDARDIAASFRNVELQFCYQAYRKDTSAFYDWNCDRLFPELNQANGVFSDSASGNRSTGTVPTEKNHWGEFYSSNTLRFNRQFATDSISTRYFNQVKSQLFSELSYQSFPEMIREPGFSTGTDTLIIRISIIRNQDGIIRECTIAYSNCITLISDHYLHLFSNMDFPVTTGNVTFYVPIVLRPESPNNYNRMDRTSINNDHFLIEYEKYKPINTH